MEGALKVVITLLITSLNIKLVSTMHNPMIRIECALGEHLECRAQFIICWKFYCDCDPDHVPLGLGMGCLYFESGDSKD